MNDLEKRLEELDPQLARRIRDSASRAGLQSHDPAARMIVEMWQAVAALHRERSLLSRELEDLGRRMDRNRGWILALLGLGLINLLLILSLLTG
jgi:hypothetical protein